MNISKEIDHYQMEPNKLSSSSAEKRKVQLLKTRTNEE